MNSIESTLKKLIKDAVREVLLEEVEKGSFNLQIKSDGQLRESKSIEMKKRDPLSIIRIDELSDLLTVSRQTIWRWGTEGKMPAKIKIAGRLVGWRYSEIEQWINNGI